MLLTPADFSFFNSCTTASTSLQRMGWCVCLGTVQHWWISTGFLKAFILVVIARITYRCKASLHNICWSMSLSSRRRRDQNKTVNRYCVSCTDFRWQFSRIHIKWSAKFITAVAARSGQTSAIPPDTSCVLRSIAFRIHQGVLHVQTPRFAADA